MKVSEATSAWYTPTTAHASPREAATDFASLLAATQSESASPAAATPALAAPAPEQCDFTNMTRQELRDWVNSEIKSGRMTVEEGGSFIGMTIRIPLNGQEDDCPSDPTRLNFLELARNGIESSLYFHDPVGADRFRLALAQMKAVQSP